MKNLKEILLSSMFLANTLASCADTNVSDKTYELADGSTLKVETEQKLSVDSQGRGLTKINGDLYVICKENGETFLGDFGPNANPQLVKDSDGTYDVRVKHNQGETYYDWDKSGNLTTNHYVNSIKLSQ